METSTRPVSRRLALAAVALGLLGAFAQPRAAEASQNCGPDISGCWNCGIWLSCCTGHKGTLRAVIRRCDSAHYECTFSGTFFKVIPFRYTVTLHVTGVADGVVYFRASRNIPLFGGSFTCTGYATACKFHANYCSPKDRGTFDMSR